MIKKGDLLTQTIASVSDNEYELTHNAAKVEPSVTYINEDLIDYDIIVKVTGDGEIVGTTKQTIGSFAQLTALNTACSKFEGWYLGDKCVSTNVVYRFRVEGDVEIIAKFSEKKYHTLGEWITVAEPTCTELGEQHKICEYCTYTEKQTLPSISHSYEYKITTQPTCTEAGIITYTCTCGDSYTEEIAATGHNFDGSKCTNCGFDKADDCSCNCHKGGIAGFFFKLINFFEKLFGQNKICKCGAGH